MDRKLFLKSLGLLPLSAIPQPLKALSRFAESFPNVTPTPVYFFGHGSPMNALEENTFSRSWKKIGQQIEKPAAIVCISAHWETKGTFITSNPSPPTIHDFGGFPQALHEVQYPAPGYPTLAQELAQTIHHTHAATSLQWGLDHGCWSILKHLFPLADIPVIQLSLDRTKPASWHYELGKELAFLRRKGVMVIGSGNMVHNLRLVDWQRIHEDNFGFDWALEANEAMKQAIVKNDIHKLVDYASQGKAFQLAIPTPEHFLPMLYCLALKEKNESIHFFNDKAVMGSLTMTSFSIH